MSLNNAANITDLIMVCPPYFQLKNLKTKNTYLFSADVSNDFLFEKEAGPIGGAEFGRHLAILGSLAIARFLKKRVAFYYLATHAKMIRHNFEINNSQLLNFEISGVTAGKRTAHITGKAMDYDGKLIFEGSIDYVIMGEALFEKFYGKHKIDKVIHSDINPYKVRRRMTGLTIKNKKAHASYGVVKAEDCLGHFEHYPALPVAIVGNLLSEIGIELFLKYSKVKYSKVLIRSAEIESKALTFHGDAVSLSASIIEINDDNSMKIISMAQHNNKLVTNSIIDVIGIL